MRMRIQVDTVSRTLYESYAVGFNQTDEEYKFTSWIGITDSVSKVILDPELLLTEAAKHWLWQVGPFRFVENRSQRRRDQLQALQDRSGDWG